MESSDKIERLIFQALDEVGQSTDTELEHLKTPESSLLGDGALDSLGLVTLSVAIEQRVESEYGQVISMIDLLLQAKDGALTVSDLTRILAQNLSGQVQDSPVESP